MGARSRRSARNRATRNGRARGSGRPSACYSSNVLVQWLPLTLHGWLDEAAWLTYVVLAVVLGFGGAPLALVVAAAIVHFANTRATDYPPGQLRLYSMRVHARIELGEGRP